MPRHALNHSTWIPENLWVLLPPLPAKEDGALVSHTSLLAAGLAGQPAIPAAVVKYDTAGQEARVTYSLAGD